MANRASWPILYKYPLFFAILGFISGILLSEFSSAGWILIILLAPAAGLIALLERNLSFLLFIPIGILFHCGGAASAARDVSIFSKYAEDTLGVYGVLYRPAETRIRGSRLLIEAQSIVADGRNIPVKGRVVIYSEKRIQGLVRGDKVGVIHPVLRPPARQENRLLRWLSVRDRQTGVVARGYIDGPESIIYLGRSREASSFIHALERLRAEYSSYVRKKFPFAASEIFLAISVGDKGAVPTEVRGWFSRSGVAHLLAISGLHLAGIAAFFYFLFRWLAGRSTYLLLRFTVPKLAALLTIAPLFVYLVIAGFATPVTRAFIMAALYLISIALGKQKNRLNILSLSALIILLVSPGAVFDPSFQLSFLSVLGILVVNKVVPLSAASLWDKVSSVALTTVGAGFAALPIVVNTFGVLPILSIPSNLLFIPLVELCIVPLGMISFLLWLVFPGLAQVAIYPSIIVTELLMRGVESISSIGWSSFAVSPLSPLAWALYLLIIGAFFILSGLRRSARYVIPPMLVLLMVFIIKPGFLGRSGSRLEAHFLDISPRLLTVVRTPRNETLVLDSGFAAGRGGGSDFMERAVIVPYMLKNGVTKIDYLFLTRNDKPSVEALGNLMNSVHVGALITPGRKLSSRIWKRVYEKDIRWFDMFKLHRGFGTGGASVELLRPQEQSYASNYGVSYPVVLKVGYGDINMLMFSDGVNAEWLERLIRDERESLRADLLYVPRLTESEIYLRLIDVVSPRFVVTSRVYSKPLEAKWGSETREASTISPEPRHLSYKLYETSTAGVVRASTDGHVLNVGY